MFNVRTIRRDILEVTQAELAGLLGVDQAAISRIETAERQGQQIDPRTKLAVEALVARKQAGYPLPPPTTQTRTA